MNQLAKHKPCGCQHLFGDGLNKFINLINNTPTMLLQTFCLSHPTVTVTIVDAIIAAPDTTTSVANNILKTSIPLKNALLKRKEGQDRGRKDSKVTKKYT